MKSTYDPIAKNYDANINERSDRRCILVPTARHYLGNIAGHAVLDLYCWCKKIIGSDPRLAYFALICWYKSVILV